MTDVYEDYITTEYHRRNMQVARVCGANAAVDQALERALKVKSIPVWLIAYLERAADRLPGLQHDLAAWRDLAPDSPYIDKTDTDAIRAAEDRGIAIGLRAAAAWHDGRRTDELSCASKYRSGTNPWFSHVFRAKDHSEHSRAIVAITPDEARKIGGGE